MTFLATIAGLFLQKIGALLPAARVEWLIKRLLKGCLSANDPREGLGLILRLHNHIEHNAGLLSVAYGKGVHSKHAHTRYHDFFTARIPSGSRVLDIGCGNGMMSKAIAETCAARVTAIDIEPGNIETARAKFAHPAITYGVCDILKETPAGDFDAVVLSNVLEHLPERAAFLRHILASLKPARILIRVPLFERDWIVPLKRELGIDWRSDPTHETEYTQESFSQEMAQAGLGVVYQETRWGEIWAETAPLSGLPA